MKRSWDDVEKMVAATAAKIRALGFEPTLILAVPRGGWVPAALLAEHLNVKQALGCDIERHRDGVSVNLSSRSFEASDKILVVEDSTESGSSLLAVKAALEKRSDCDVKTCALVANENGALPDIYYASENPVSTFPWDYD